MNYFQNVEYTICDNRHQYLLIHKSGCTYVRSILEEHHSVLDVRSNKNSYLPSWTVLRDPYKRFISGITYDLKLFDHNIFVKKNKAKKILLDKNFIKSVFSRSGPFRTQGKTVHYIPQFFYYLPENIDFFVMLDDIDMFFESNMNITSEVMEKTERNKTKNKEKEIIHSIIENDKELKRSINDHLSFEYYAIDMLGINDRIWKWNYGKVL
jgi:hypothetical protein